MSSILWKNDSKIPQISGNSHDQHSHVHDTLHVLDTLQKYYLYPELYYFYSISTYLT
jgi:hypothetical protein